DAVSAIPAARRRRSPWVFGAVMLGIAIASAATAWRFRPQPTALANPLENAVFTRFTNFEGTERSAAISPDGRFVVFRSDRDGPLDVWIGRVGTGRFSN